jgi:hypothetical protein
MTSFLLGFAAGFVARDVMGPIGSGTGFVLRPIAKEVVKGGLVVGGVAAAAGRNIRDGWNDVVTSARADLTSKPRVSRAKA